MSEYKVTYGDKEVRAYNDLKIKIVNLMHDFMLQYATKGDDCLYPDCGYILEDVLHDCWKEACNQMNPKATE
jgi:hypothetical protein